MNYRHAFHAGNFADVVKHVLLTRMLAYLAQKPAPFRYIDTHAGIGRYDLTGVEATRSGEWRDGIGRLASHRAAPDVADLLAPYLTAVGPCDREGRPLAYPGSPAIAQHLLRPQDRLLLCELHPQDVTALRATMARDRRVKVLAVDGYQGLRASLPPPERRGLVLIDPPFEQPGEFEQLTAALADAIRRWAGGTYALWYPLKDDDRVGAFLPRLKALGFKKSIELELTGGPGPGLRGSGLFIVNQPYTLRREAELLLPHLASAFGGRNAGWRWRIDEVTT